MKKILGYSLLTAACIMLSGCASAHAEDDSKPRVGYVNKDITVKSGYYTCKEDDSYIHVDGNMIERCGFDHYTRAENGWNEIMAELDDQERERQAKNHEVFIENTVELGKEFDQLKEFTVYTIPFSTYDPETSDDTTLVLLPEDEIETSSYRGGYDYNEDGSITCDYTYYYAGEELPV